MILSRLTVVCFAVKEEARFFKPNATPPQRIEILLTGIGPRNAEKAIRKLLAEQEPGLVLSCGFAGGLSPELVAGMVVFAVDAETGLEKSLLAAGARPARFRCVQRVVTTAREKRTLWESSGADAVEMESGIICDLCRGQNIPSGTARVVLDTANEDLPLDFNELMSAQQRMDYGKLAISLLRSPGKLGALLRLQRQAVFAAQKLAEVLEKVLPAPYL